MNKRKLFVMGVFSFLLTFTLLFAACPVDDTDTGSGGPNNVTSTGPQAEMPSITLQPASKSYFDGDTIAELSVTAAVNENPEEGTVELSYQWYKADSFVNTGGEIIENEIGSTYQPTEAGYYYVVITNTLTIAATEEEEEIIRHSSKASNPVKITIVDPSAPPPAAAITVNDDDKHQYVRGFGGMSNAFGIGAPARYMELKDIDTMFNPDTGLGLKFLRIKIFVEPLNQVISGMVYPQMGNNVYFDIVKRVNQYGGYVLASPWTPPAEWKVNNNIAGTKPSYLLENRYLDYAQYLRQYALDMAAAGAPIYAIAVQNEATFPASYEGCEWSSTQHLNFFRDFGNRISKFPTAVPGFGGGKATPRVLVTTGEPHNDVTWNDSVLNNATARDNADIVTYHIYGSLNSRYALGFQYEKENWMTEHNINSGEGNYLQDSSWNFVWPMADEIDHVIRNNDSHVFIWWYAKRFYSFIGDGSNGTANGAILPRGYVMSHYAKYATDTIRVGATLTGHSNASDVRVSAFRRWENPTASDWEQAKLETKEDSISLVIYNRRTLATEPSAIRINLPAGFEALDAYAIISDSNRKHEPCEIVLSPDGTYGDLTLPGNAIISVKFTR